MSQSTTPATDLSRPAHPTFSQALRYWLKLGFISFGGPAGQIAIMHQELVEQRRWISEARFLHALNYCMVLPGPEAQQLACYLGWLLHGVRGGIMAGLLFVLPSLVMLIALSLVYMMFGHAPLLQAVFEGIKPAVAVIVLQAAQRIGRRSLHSPALWLLAALSFVAIFLVHLGFPLIILLAASVGYVGGRVLPHQFQASSHTSGKRPSGAPALIDDDTELPDSKRFSWRGLMSTLICGMMLWCVPMAFLLWIFGWQHAYTQMAWFFTTAALLTFGGAYAVLPYVMQAAVEQFQWVSSRQMMDGLALGESTPGPLIMVLVFVGFVAAYQHQFLGEHLLWQAGVLAALLVTWFTFLPSFVFILAGAPLIETTHRRVQFTAPLSAISAAVVGVVLHLGLLFAWHVVFLQGVDMHQINLDALSLMWDVVNKNALLIGVAAAIALYRFKLQVTHVLALCALLGCVAKLFG